MDVALLVANPVNALARRIRFRLRLVQRLLARAVHLLDALAFLFRLFLRQLAIPAHLLGDLLLRLIRVAVFLLQLHVFVRARVGLLQELLVIVLVPFLLRVFLAALLLLDGLGEFAHKARQAVGGILRALLFLRFRQPPLRRGNLELIIRALDDDASIPFAEPFKVKTVGPAGRRPALAFGPVEKFLHRHGGHPHLA